MCQVLGTEDRAVSKMECLCALLLERTETECRLTRRRLEPVGSEKEMTSLPGIVVICNRLCVCVCVCVCVCLSLSLTHTLSHTRLLFKEILESKPAACVRLSLFSHILLIKASSDFSAAHQHLLLREHQAQF